MSLSSVAKQVILAGDFNINLLSPTSTQSDYTNLLSDFSLI